MLVICRGRDLSTIENISTRLTDANAKRRTNMRRFYIPCSTERIQSSPRFSVPLFLEASNFQIKSKREMFINIKKYDICALRDPHSSVPRLQFTNTGENLPWPITARLVGVVVPYMVKRAGLRLGYYTITVATTTADQ